MIKTTVKFDYNHKINNIFNWFADIFWSICKLSPFVLALYVAEEMAQTVTRGRSRAAWLLISRLTNQTLCCGVLWVGSHRWQATTISITDDTGTEKLLYIINPYTQNGESSLLGSL